MTAIVTNSFRQTIIEDLFNAADSSQNNFYIGFGRTLPWDSADVAPTPLATVSTEEQARDRLQSVKKVSAYSRVAPRFNWSSGTVYSAFSNRTVSTFPYYVMTDENKVYVCIQQGKDANGVAVVSLTKPTSTATTPQTTGEGYVWKYLYTVGSVPATNFLAANFIPVDLQDSSASASYELTQLAVQNAAVAGEVVNIEVTGGGSGYTSATVTVEGDGTGATATATVTSGSVTKIEMTNRGSGYTRATVTVAGDGASATAVANVSQLGLGANAIQDLSADAIMYNTRVDGVEGDDFIVGNDFRQVVLLQNPKQEGSSADFTDVSGIVSKRLVVAPGFLSSPTFDDVITGDTSGAKAIVDQFDEPNLTIWYHQTEETGFADFTANEGLVGYTMTLDSAGAYYLAPDINNRSGELMYISNRAPVVRSADQIDDVKVIIRV